MTVSETRSQVLRNRYGFGIGTIGRDMAYTLISMFLLFYLSDILEVSTPVFAAITVVLVLVRAIDAVIDPFVGVLVDNTRSRWGRFKPWIVAGVLGSSAAHGADVHPLGDRLMRRSSRSSPWCTSRGAPRSPPTTSATGRCCRRSARTSASASGSAPSRGSAPRSAPSRWSSRSCRLDRRIGGDRDVRSSFFWVALGIAVVMVVLPARHGAARPRGPHDRHPQPHAVARSPVGDLPQRPAAHDSRVVPAVHDGLRCDHRPRHLLLRLCVRRRGHVLACSPPCSASRRSPRSRSTR